MSMENAVKFVQKLREDQALYTSLAVMKPEEVLSTAAKMGMQFTEDELKEALNKAEISEKDMEDAAGGRLSGSSHRLFYCPNGPDNEHKWEKVGHEEVPATFLFWDYTNGYDVCRCIYCGMIIRNHT